MLRIGKYISRELSKGQPTHQGAHAADVVGMLLWVVTSMAPTQQPACRCNAADLQWFHQDFG